MTDLIITICTWLISHHSVTLAGWQWLLLFPISGAVFVVLVFLVSHLTVRAAFYR